MSECVICNTKQTCFAVTKCKDTGSICWNCEIRWRRLQSLTGKGPWFTCPCCREVNQKILVTAKTSEYQDWSQLDGIWQDFFSAENEPGVPITGIYFKDKSYYEDFLERVNPTRCTLCSETLIDNISQQQAGKKVSRRQVSDNVQQDNHQRYPDRQTDTKPPRRGKGVLKSTGNVNVDILREHLMVAHDTLWCDVCFQYHNASKFPAEHALYQGSEKLNVHCKGQHVWCGICDRYYYDVDEYNFHWRGADNHFSCRICQAESRRAVLFASYDLLWKHHQKAHFPCTFPECKTAEQVFNNSHQLQLHLAKTHCMNTEQFTNVGRRGLVFNLDVDHSGDTESKKKKSRRPPSEISTALSAETLSDLKIPTQMLAEMQSIQELMKSKPPFDKRMNRRLLDEFYSLIMRLSDNPKAIADELQTECYKLNTGETEPLKLLGYMALYLFLYSGNQRTTTSGDWERLTLPGRLLFLMLYTKPYQPLEKFSKELSQALKDIVDSIPAAQEDVESTTSTSAVVAAEDKTILSYCTFLPISRVLPFSEAVDWALREYIRETLARIEVKSKGEIPDTPKLPVNVGTKLKAYDEETLTSYCNLIKDMSGIIPTPLLENFLSLRPLYARWAGAKAENLAKQRFAIDESTSRHWGEACDRALSQYTIHHLRSIKEYVTLTKCALNTARECLDGSSAQCDPRLSVPSRMIVPAGVSSNSTRRSTFVSSKNHSIGSQQAVKYGKGGTSRNLAFEDQDEFPSLVPSQTQPATVPARYQPAWKAPPGPKRLVGGTTVTYCGRCGRRNNSSNSCSCC